MTFKRHQKKKATAKFKETKKKKKARESHDMQHQKMSYNFVHVDDDPCPLPSRLVINRTTYGSTFCNLRVYASEQSCKAGTPYGNPS